MQQSALIVEDDQDIAHLLHVHLNELALDVEHVFDAETAADKLKQSHYDIVLLDIMLPGIDGLTLCREIKSITPHISVVLVTSKSSEMDRIIGLEMGADDYICKPFSYREFQARVKAQLRHIRLLQNKEVTQDNVQLTALSLGRLNIDTRCHEAKLGDTPLNLTATEFELLHFFASHANQVFSRTQLLESVWGYQHSGYEHTVNSHINRLRTKLESLGAENIIETVWGVGYKLNAKYLTQA